jgi:hypothetical protein
VRAFVRRISAGLPINTPFLLTLRLNGFYPILIFCIDSYSVKLALSQGKTRQEPYYDSLAELQAALRANALRNTATCSLKRRFEIAAAGILANP